MRSDLPEQEELCVLALVLGCTAVFAVADTIGVCFGGTMQIRDGAIAFSGSTIFSIGYILFVLLIMALLIRVRRRLYKQVMNGFIGVAVISIMMMVASRLRIQSTFTASTFLFPLIAVMYLLHSNPYDAKLGTNDLRGLNNLMQKEVKSDFIGELVMDELKKVDQVAYIRFASVYRQFTDVETFTKEIEKLQDNR